MANIVNSAAGSPPNWPTKTREVRNHHFDTRIWNRFKFREGDIVISTWGKSGTSWMQQIISQLVFNGNGDINPHDHSIWLDLRVPDQDSSLALLEGQRHRRFIKTHAPIDALVYDQRAKYIFVARDGRDAMWSMHNHLFHGTPQYYEIMNDSPGRIGPAIQRPPEDPTQFFRDFLRCDDDTTRIHTPFWPHVRGWWNARALPNMLVVHFNDLKMDLDGEIHRIADFLDMKVPEEKWEDIVHHCTFQYMKENARRLSPAMAEVIFENGGDTLIHKGKNGQWRAMLTEDEIAQYEGQARSELGEECAKWLAHGRQSSVP